MQSEIGKKNRKRQAPLKSEMINENENVQRQPPPLKFEMTNENENVQRQPPLLLTIHEKKQMIYRPVDGKSQNMDIPILVDKYVIASTHGWLVLMDYSVVDLGCCLWNPSSNDMIKLPRLQDFWFYRKCVLSKPPTEPDCHILFLAEELFRPAFCKIGDVEFVYQSQIKEVDQLNAITSFQGKIYGVMNPDYKFVIIEFVGKRMEFRPILINGEQPLKAPVIEKSWVLLSEIQLINSHTGNELLYVMKDLSQDSGRDCSEFLVFRVDINRMECIEVDDIGDQVILIGQHGTGFCCSSDGTIFKPNSIYYILERGSCVYMYDLDDKSTTSWLPHDVGLKYINHFWVDLKLEELS